MKKKCLLGIMLFLSACQPSSLEDFQYEGSCQVRLLLEEMAQIETRQDLARMEPILKNRFEKIVFVMMQAKAFQQKHPDCEPVFSAQSALASERLLDEMQRIYALEGGRESIERAQREAMLKLDAYCKKN